MAKQRWTLATFAGESAAAVTALVRSWRIGSDPGAVDRFCAALRENGLMLPIVYFCEWADRWLMGDLVPGPVAEGRLYQTACLSPEQALAWASGCGHQFPEQEWLAARLREAAVTWDEVEPRAVVILREVLDGSTTDDEVHASLHVVPEWLFPPDSATDRGMAPDAGR
jgi:hypothetical protein